VDWIKLAKDRDNWPALSKHGHGTEIISNWMTLGSSDDIRFVATKFLNN